MTAAMKARAVYRAIEKAQARGLVGLDKDSLHRWCASSHGMTPSQVDSGIAALMEGEMLKYQKTLIMDRINGFRYRIVNVAVLADRTAFQRDVDSRTRYAITHGRRTKTKIKSFIDDAIAHGDVHRAVHLSRMHDRADDLVSEAQNLQHLVATL